MEEEKLYPPKVKAMYEAVLELFASGRELSTLKVSEITAYEYFATKEEMIVGAIQYEAAKHVAIIMELIENGQSFQEIIFRGMDMLEATHRKYGGFALLERILSDKTISGSGILKELVRRKEDCGAAMDMTGKMLELAADKGLVKDRDAFRVWSAVLSQFVSYAFYLTHGELFPDVNREEARNFVYESIIKILN